MGFLRKSNASQDKGQAVPMPAEQAKPAETKSASPAQGSLISRIRNYAIDSYRGLYKIVLEPSMPTRETVALMLLGLVIGLIWAYAISPTIFTDAGVHRLNQSAQDQWVKMTAANYAAGFYDEQAVQILLNQVDSPSETINRLLTDPNTNQFDRQVLVDIQSIASSVTGTEAPVSPGFFGELISLLVPILLVTIITPIFVLVWRLLIYPNIVAGIIERFRESRDPALAERNRRSKAELATLQEQKRLLEQMKREQVADVELGAPVMQTLKVYNQGRNFDESDEIELPLDQGGDFLGQCGAVIAEAVDPDPIAIEVWLFDMFSQQNLKKIFVTPQGYADPGIRARLEADIADPASDIFVANPGARLIIDSDKLRLQADMVSIEVAPDGRFNTFRMKLTSWQKSQAFADAHAASPVAPAYSPASYAAAPPPAAPAPMPAPPRQEPAYTPPPPPANLPFPPENSDYDMRQPPAAYGAAPLPPSPLNYPPGLDSPDQTFDDDDIFGSTGEFTPINR